MATKLTLLSIDKGLGPYENVRALVTLSGNYAAGGDALDLTTLYNQSDPAGRRLTSDLLPISAAADSMASVVGNSPTNYKVCTYTNPNNGTAAVPLTPATCLLQAFTGVTEEAAGAYGNQYLSDYVVLELTFQGQR